MKRISLAVLVCAFFVPDAMAQCGVNAKTNRDGVWARNASVAIWVHPDLWRGTSYIQQAVTNWANSSTATMMGVTLTLTTNSAAANVRVYPGEVPGHPGAAGGFRGDPNDGSGVVSGEMRINPARIGDGLAIGQTFAHELGHPFGLTDCSFTCTAGSSVMNNPQGTINDTSRGTLGPTSCDETAIRNQWSSEFTSAENPCSDFCELIESGEPGEPGEITMNGCVCDDPDRGVYCQNCSPILVDVDGDGIDLTAAAAGVAFKLNPAFTSRLGWTHAGDDDAWLALDRDCNGTIDHGAELFGNFTAQPASANPHGYIALAVFDHPNGGGNGDNRITAADPIFGELRLWTDRNHDGRSTHDELRTLTEAGVESIDLDWRDSAKHDQNGNVFRYRAKVKTDGRERWSYDVFLANLP